jgi:hypothetical protein
MGDFRFAGFSEPRRCQCASPLTTPADARPSCDCLARPRRSGVVRARVRDFAIVVGPFKHEGESVCQVWRTRREVESGQEGAPVARAVHARDFSGYPLRTCRRHGHPCVTKRAGADSRRMRPGMLGVGRGVPGSAMIRQQPLSSVRITGAWRTPRSWKSAHATFRGERVRDRQFPVRFVGVHLTPGPLLQLTSGG